MTYKEPTKSWAIPNNRLLAAATAARLTEDQEYDLYEIAGRLPRDYTHADIKQAEDYAIDAVINNPTKDTDK